MPYRPDSSQQLARWSVVAVLLLLAGSARALADTVKVTTDRALVWTSPTGAAVVVTQLEKDDTVEVIRRVGGWYEIVVPTGSLSGEFRTGFVNALQVAIDAVGPPSDRLVRARMAAQTAQQRPRRAATSFLYIDGVHRQGDEDLTQAASIFSKALGENTTFNSNYGNTTGWSFDFLAGGPVWRWLGVGFGVDYRQRERSVPVRALVPHPYFVDTLRPASFTTAPLKSREGAVTFSAMLLPPMFGPVKVVAYAGPSVFRVSQFVVTDITLDERFPYDIATISGATTVERKGTFGGYHAGADVSVFFTRSVGVGVGARYSRATIKKFDEDTATTRGIAGGVATLGGVRFRF